MLKLVVALALVIGSVQCAAACTPVACAQPPCHHHKQSPACTHELIPATVVQSSVMPVSFSSEAVHTSLVFFPLDSRDTSAMQESPPIPPLTILRI